MPSITFPVALAAGLLSFLSPCILPLVPVYIANIAGSSVLTASPPSRRYIFLHTLSFVAGFSLVFVILGAAMGLLGVMVPRGLLRNIAGVLLILFGLFLLAATKVPWLNYEKYLPLNRARGTGYLRSLSVGAIFSLALGSCTAPVLGGDIDSGFELPECVARSLSSTGLLLRAWAPFHRCWSSLRSTFTISQVA